MVDFLKIIVKDPIEIARIWSDNLLIFHNYNERLNHFDFETLITKETKKWNGILFCRFQNHIEVLFRPHYFFNDNLHNANDFTVKDCVAVIKRFLDAFKITELEKYKIVNIEFGVNYIIEGYGKELIRFFEYWQKNEFQTHPGLSYSRKACRYKPNGKDNNYKIVKSYSKGIQHPMFCDEETNRFEIKSKESKYCKSMGVSDVSDLIKISSYKQMGEELIKTSKQVLILDHKTEFKNLNEAEQVKLRSYLSGHTWYEQTLLSKNMFGRMKDRYMCLLDKTGFNVNSVFQSKIQSKVSELLGVELSPLTKALIKPRGDDSNIIISGIVPPLDLSTHYCQLTGINLKHEGPLRKGKGVPKYIRSGTINYLRRNDLGVYYHLQSWLIPKIDKRDFKLPKSAKSMKNHMCHVVRNRYASKLRRKANLYKQGYDLEDINKCLAGGTYLELISEHANELICE